MDKWFNTKCYQLTQRDPIIDENALKSLTRPLYFIQDLYFNELCHFFLFPSKKGPPTIFGNFCLDNISNWKTFELLIKNLTYHNSKGSYPFAISFNATNITNVIVNVIFTCVNGNRRTWVGESVPLCHHTKQ